MLKTFGDTQINPMGIRLSFILAGVMTIASAVKFLFSQITIKEIYVALHKELIPHPTKGVWQPLVGETLHRLL